MTQLGVGVMSAFFVLATIFLIDKMGRKKKLWGFASIGGAVSALLAGTCIMCLLYPVREISHRVEQWWLFSVCVYLLALGISKMIRAISDYLKIRRRNRFLISRNKKSRRMKRRLKKEEEREIKRLLKNSNKQIPKRVFKNRKQP